MTNNGSLVEVKIQRATLFLTEAELRQLPSEVLARGLRRGKRILRARQMERRMGRIQGDGTEKTS